MNDRDFIRSHLSAEDVLCQLAEEAAELAQAALKLTRKIKGTNPTPKSYGECWEALTEEVADVELCLDLLGMFEGMSKRRELAIIQLKAARWVARLKKGEINAR